MPIKVNVVSRAKTNPFYNLLDMVNNYLTIYINSDMESLKAFVHYSGSSAGSRFISSLDMYQCFVTSMYWSSIDPDESDKWLDFDNRKMDELLQNSFFDEYNRSLPFLRRYCRRIYPMLDVYSFVRLQAFAATVLPQELLWDVHYIWTYEDFLYQIYGLTWYETISMIYKSYGIHWFSNNGENDPILYKWACYAVAACKKIGTFSDELLKRDLNDIYKELLIAFTIRGTIDKNADIIDYVQSCITNFDEDRINNLIEKVKALQKENNELIDSKKQLNEGIRILRFQLKELQAEEEKADYDMIEEMEYRIYCLFPQNSAIDDRVESFKDIWEKLDVSTKKDIKISITMFENFESFDLALFPMIRSLEHEFARNYFDPFHDSKNFKEAGTPICSNCKYEKTHEALAKKGNTHPTMGSIPHIGRAMADVKAQEASNVIRAFKDYLGDKCSAFQSICRSLDTYRLGVRKYKLVDLRNGIAHGDDNIIQNVDKECYEEVTKLLYEPPLQILYEIIRYSMISSNAD